MNNLALIIYCEKIKKSQIKELEEFHYYLTKSIDLIAQSEKSMLQGSNQFKIKIPNFIKLSIESKK